MAPTQAEAEASRRGHVVGFDIAQFVTSPHRKLLVHAQGRDIQVHDLETRRVLAQIHTKKQPSRVTVSPAARYVCISTGRVLRLYGVEKAAWMWSSLMEEGYASALFFARGGCVSAHDGDAKFARLRLHDLDTGEVTKRAKVLWLMLRLSAVEWSGGGTQLVLRSEWLRHPSGRSTFAMLSPDTLEETHRFIAYCAKSERYVNRGVAQGFAVYAHSPEHIEGTQRVDLISSSEHCQPTRTLGEGSIVTVDGSYLLQANSAGHIVKRMGSEEAVVLSPGRSPVETVAPAQQVSPTLKRLGDCSRSGSC